MAKGLGFRAGAYIEEDGVVIRIAIIPINPIEPLRELHVTHFLPNIRIHVEAHGLPQRLAVIYVMITIQVEEVGRVREHRAHAHQRVHGPRLLVVVEPRAFLSGHVHQAGQLLAVRVVTAAVSEKYLPNGQDIDQFLGIECGFEAAAVFSSRNWDSSEHLGFVRTWIMPGWSRVLLPGHGVPSCMVHPSSGTFCAFATNAFTRTLNSSYSRCKKNSCIQPHRQPLLHAIGHVRGVRIRVQTLGKCFAKLNFSLPESVAVI